MLRRASPPSHILCIENAIDILWLDGIRIDCGIFFLGCLGRSRVRIDVTWRQGPRASVVALSTALTRYCFSRGDIRHLGTMGLRGGAGRVLIAQAVVVLQIRVRYLLLAAGVESGAPGSPYLLRNDRTEV